MNASTGGPDVLRDGLFVVSSPARAPTLSLAELLATLLTADTITGFPNLAAEQHGQWWRFLVRCASKTLHQLGLTVKKAGSLTAEPVAEILGGLVPDGGWRLWQPNPTKPGFQQTSVPGGTSPAEADYKLEPISDLTANLGAKDHERKSKSVRWLDAEGVVYALIELQTMAIYGGVGRYQSQLMGSKSGAGSGAPFMGVRLPDGLGATFRHDVGVMLERWDQIAVDLAGDVWAIWALPWRGQKGEELPAAELDPAFIPFGRQLRLAPPADGLFGRVWHRSAKAGRVDDHTGGGDLGDPFCPTIMKGDQVKVRGTLGKGYDYREVVQLLFGEGLRPAPTVAALASKPEQAEGVRVLFEGLAYEQGKTIGFHHREILLPPKEWGWFEQPAPIQEAHTRLLNDITNTRKSLRGAAWTIIGSDHGALNVPGDLLDEVLDREYLPKLFAAAERVAAGQPAADTAWVKWLTEQALAAFSAALPWLPSPTAERLKREVLAEARLRHLLKERLVAGDSGEEQA